MAVFLSPVGGVAAQFFTNTGAVLTGGKLYTYAAGTTTPAATYTSSGAGTYNPNPIVLDAAGRVPNSGEIWLTDGAQYKFVLKDSNDVLIATYDNISGINSNFTNFLANQEIQTATAGQTVFTLVNPYAPGANTLSVFVDGVNQYGPGAAYAYLETGSNTVTFLSGLHVGASVKFTTVQSLTSTQSTSAALVSYNQGSSGAVATTVQAKLRESVSVLDFGADPTGVTDSTAAIQAALAASKIVIFPSGTYNISDTLTVTLAGQTILGNGKPQITQTITSKLVLYAFAVNNVTVDGLWITPGPSATGPYNTAGISLNGCIGWTIQNNLFTGHSSSAVFLLSSNDCSILNNRFTLAVNNQFSNDITLWYSCNRNVICGNKINSGADQGITISTISTGDTANDNIIEGNIVEESYRYGIVLYNSRQTNTNVNMRNTVVIGNVVKNIYGLRNAVGARDYGAGIYALSAENVTIIGNALENCNVNTDLFDLSPAAIGVADTSCMTIANNTISNTKYIGILVQDASQRGDGTGSGASYRPLGFTQITGNNIRATTQAGIYIDGKHKININGNTVDGSLTSGITFVNSNLTNYPTSLDVSISNNIINTPATNAIVLNKADYPVINGNICTAQGGYGIQVLSNYATINGNSLTGGYRGLYLMAGGTKANVEGNTITGNSDYGMLAYHPYLLGSGNLIYGNTAGSYGGTYSTPWTLDNTGTPDVSLGTTFVTGGTTAITNFLNGRIGQIIVIRCANIVTFTYGSTIFLSGATNFVSTVGSTISFIKQDDGTSTGVWYEIGRMLR